MLNRAATMKCVSAFGLRAVAMRDIRDDADGTHGCAATVLV
jgi:hypothetical protein